MPDDLTADAAQRQEAPFEMANLRPERTGLPFVIFVSQQGGARHGPRIKISPLPHYNADEAVTVTLEKPPRALGPVDKRDLELVAQWIELNREAIEGYWDGTIAYTEDLLAQIRPVLP